MANTTTKIDNIRFILTLDGGRRIIRDGAIVVEGSRIRRVGKAEELKDVGADRVIDGSEMVATPGFVNGHLHISYAHATRGIFPDTLPPVDYLTNVFKLALQMRPEEEYYASLLALNGVPEVRNHHRSRSWNYPESGRVHEGLRGIGGKGDHRSLGD